MSFAFLYAFSDHLQAAIRRGAGKFPLVPRAVPSWKIEVTKGGEVDYIAWPIVEYDTAAMLWAMQGNQWAAQGPNRTPPPWPLGRGDGVVKTLDSYIPGQYGDDKAATKFFKERVFVYVPTVKQARDAIESGMELMDSDYPWTRRISPLALAGFAVGIVGLTYLYRR